MTLRQQRHALARLNALRLRAEAAEYEVQSVALADDLSIDDRVRQLECARSRSRQAWAKYRDSAALYGRTYPPVALRPVAWLRSLFGRRAKA